MDSISPNAPYILDFQDTELAIMEREYKMNNEVDSNGQTFEEVYPESQVHGLEQEIEQKDFEIRNLSRKVETLESVLNSIASTCADEIAKLPLTPNSHLQIYTLQRIELHARRFIPARNPTVYDILPFFDSYIADLESNMITADNETKTKWESDRIPFIVDMLGDFGQGSWTDEEIYNAVVKHEGSINE